MFGIADLIVCLWLLPVALYVVIPLSLLCIRILYRLVVPQKSCRSVSQDPDGWLVRTFSVREARG